MAILDVSAGVVTALRGEAFVRSPEGNLVPVKVGDRLEVGQLILAASGEVLETISASDDRAAVTAAGVDQAIANLEQAQSEEDAPAAGLAGGEGSLLGPGLRVDRVVEQVGSQSFDGDASPQAAGGDVQGGSLTDQRVLPASNDTPPVPLPLVPAVLPFVVIDGEPATEGDPVLFNVRLTEAADAPVTVRLNLLAGSEPANAADPQADTSNALEYRLQGSGTWQPVTSDLTFAPGATLIQVRVATKDDDVVEGEEFIQLKATVVSGETANTETGNDTAITDNDKPFLVVFGQDVTEGEVAVFTVNLTQPSPEPVTVRLALLAGSDPADAAQPGVDTIGPLEFFNAGTQQWAQVDGDLTLAAGQTQIQVRVATKDDAEVELVEFIQLQATVISGDTANAVASNDKAITDNDKPFVVVYGQDGIEGDYAGFTVNLTQASPEDVVISLDLLPGSEPVNAASPSADVDGPLEYFDAASGGWVEVTDNLTIAAGETQVQLRVKTLDDSESEGVEYLRLQATIVEGNVANDPAEPPANDVAIADNDLPSMVVFSDDSIEGRYANFSVNLTSGTNEIVSVALSVEAGGSVVETAQPGVDAVNDLEFLNNDTGLWEAVTGPLSFLPGSTRIDVRVATIDDTEVESVEYLRLQASVVEGSVRNPVTWNDAAITDDEGRPVEGTPGGDELLGQAGDDSLQGSGGDDLLIGAQGNDALTGGDGADVFAWRLSDVVDGVTTTDRIADFSLLPPAEGGDVLDLRDLLQGENTLGGTGNLTQYLRFDTSGSDTVIQVNVSGEFGSSPDEVNQQIILQGVNLRTAYGLDASSGDADLIARMLTEQKLVVDAF